MNFWQKLKKKKDSEPMMVLAPMADVTDRAFRRVIAKYGKPDAMWTEFVSADGLFLGGYEALINDLAFTDSERPIVAQFFTSKPEMMERAAALARKLGFDGIDINMGCPDRSVEKQGAGAALIRAPKLAQEIVVAAKAGAGDLPVSVKTRLGYNRNEIETWVPALLETKPALLTVHARTRKEMSLVPARWEEIRRVVEIRDQMKSDALIFGNGDAESIADARVKARQSGADGVMLGRAIFGNPLLFSSLKDENKSVLRSSSEARSEAELVSQISAEEGYVPSIREKLRVLAEHTKLFEEIVQPKPPTGQGKSFAVMKKHFKAYVNGFDGAKELRMKLMEAENAGEVEKIIFEYLKSFNHS